MKLVINGTEYEIGDADTIIIKAPSWSEDEKPEFWKKSGGFVTRIKTS